MAFEPVKRMVGAEGMATVAFNLAAGQTIKKGMALTASSGALVKATSAANRKILIAAENKVSTATVVPIQVYIPSDIQYKVPYTGTAPEVLGTADLNADAETIVGPGTNALFQVHKVDTVAKVAWVGIVNQYAGL